MRKVVCIALLICAISVDNIAQSYQPIPDTNAFWKEVTAFFLPGNPQSTVRDEFVNGDTVIGSYTYIKVYATGVVHTNSGTATFTNAYQGAIRNDSMTQRVYYVRPTYNTEELVYDYNLSVGQQIPNSSVYPWAAGATITSIDSIYYLNAWHQRFHTDEFGPAGELMFIEGMGSNYGLTLCYCSTLQKMDCFYQDDRPCWPDTSSGCASEVGIVDYVGTHELTVYPNPASHVMSILSSYNGIVSIYNAEGKLVNEKAVVAETTLEIDVSGYAKGIYILIYSNSAGAQRNRKFIVE